MSFSWTRVGAILLKELRDYRRNRFVIGTMAMVPVLFIILPMIQLFAANATGKDLGVHVGLSLLYMLVIPVMMPSVVSAYSVVGEREQGTLEPVLITPIRREEFLIGMGDLGGSRGLCTVHGCARRTAVERVGRRAAAGHPRLDVAERDHRVDRPRARSRRRAAGRRPARLARRDHDVRP
jgi:hypothetical protein